MNPDVLYPEANKEIRQFVISATRNMGIKRDASKGSFIDTVLTTTKDFYGEVLQNLRAWKAPPPKLKKPPEEDAGMDEEVELPTKVEEAVDQSQAAPNSAPPST